MTTPHPADERRRLPLSVYVLAAGVFCLGTSEFMVAGLLPAISADLGVTISRAGMLITGFALGMMLGAPVMAIVTLRFPPKVTVLTAGAVFVLSHLVPLLGNSFPLILGSRVLAAVAAAAYWAVGGVLVMRLSGEGNVARGLAVLIGGLTVANVLGVPLGTAIGEALGWHGTFVAVALATAGVLVLVHRGVPALPATGSGGLGDRLRREVATLRDRRLWLALATTAAYQAAVFCAFSYLAPLFTNVSGLPSGVVPVLLLLFGLGSLLGVTIGGRYADKNMLANVFISLAAMAVTMAVLVALSGAGWWVAPAVFGFGAAAFSIAAALNGRVFSFAAAAPTLAAGVNVSAFNVGNAVGPWIGGLVISAGYGLRAPVWAALALVGVAVLLATCSMVVEHRGNTADERATVPDVRAECSAAAECVGPA